MKDNDFNSTTGWWVVSILYRISSEYKVSYWNNHHLIEAENKYIAFKKANAIGEDEQRVGNEAFSDSNQFLGITNIIPLYDEISDGVELFYDEFESDEETAEPLFNIISETDL